MAELGESLMIFDSRLSLVVEVCHVGVNVVNCFGGCLNIVAVFPDAGLDGGSFVELLLNNLELFFDGREDVVGEHLIFRNVLILQ